MPRAELYYRGSEDPQIVFFHTSKNKRLENGTIFVEYLDDEGSVVARANTSDLVHEAIDHD